MYTRGIDGLNALTGVLGALVFLSGVAAMVPAWRATLVVKDDPRIAPLARMTRIALVLWVGFAAAGQVAVAVQGSGVPFSAMAADVVAIAWVMFVGQVARAANVQGAGRLRNVAYAFVALHALVQLVPFAALYQRGMSMMVMSPLLTVITVLSGLLPLLAAFLDARRVLGTAQTERVAPPMGEVSSGPDDPWRPQ